MKNGLGKWRTFVWMAGAVLLIGTGVSGGSAFALDWPTQDITFIVPYNPGGGFDLTARGAAPFISKYLPKKVNVMIKNVPGAGTKVGLREVIKAKPDGHTIGVFEIAQTEVMRIGGKLEDLDVTNFVYLGRMDQLADSVVLGTKSPYKKPADMKGRTIKFINYGHAAMHRCVVIAQAMGVTPRFVSYGGASEAFLALMQLDLDVVVTNWVTTARMMKANEGKVFMMFVTSTVPGLNVPSGKDLGLVYDESILGYTHTIGTTPGVSTEIAQIWERTLNKVFSDPEWQDHMNKKIGYPPDTLTGEKLRKYVASVKGSLEKHKGEIMDMYAGKYGE